MSRFPIQRLTDDRRYQTRIVKRLHWQRRAAGVCIQSAKHGPAVKGGRCAECWERKLAAEREAWKQWGARGPVRSKAAAP